MSSIQPQTIFSPTCLRRFLTLFICLSFALGSSCAVTPFSKPQPPTVELADIDIIRFGLKSQELALTLDVFNPNSFDLPVNTLSFIASFTDVPVAKGILTDKVLLTANSDTEVVVNVVARAGRLITRLLAAGVGAENSVDYNINGFVKLDNWPARIPFNVDDTLSLDGS